ncbi:MAG: hypothetical protein CMH93_06960 [Oceanicaulis sp.]|nr:hypothetical protein [Oceanicaulis sp.]
MASRNAGTVAIKLDLRGQEELKLRLGELGPVGDRAFKDLMRAAKPVKGEMDLVGGSVLLLKDGLGDLAQQAGPVARLFTTVSPLALGFGAAIGVVAMALREVFVLMERSRETAFWAEELENAERASGLLAERILSIGSAAQMAGADFNAVLSGMEEFSKRIGEYRATGQGEARDAFDALGLRDLVDNGADATAILDAVLERMREIDDPSRRLALADKLGLREAAPLLQQSADEMARMLEAAEGINSTFTASTIQRFADAAEAIREAELRQTRAVQMQSLSTLQAEVARARVLAEIDERKAAALHALTPVRERETEVLDFQATVLERQADLLEQRLRQVQGVRDAEIQVAGDLADTRRRLEEINAEQERRLDIQQRQQEALTSYYSMLESWGDRTPGGGAGGASNDELDTERRRELEALVEQSLRSLMTPLQEIRELESELNDAREHGIEISQAQIDTIIRTRMEAAGLAGKLADLTDEERKAAGAAEAANDPLEAQKELLDSLTGPADAARERLGNLYKLWADSPEHADIITAEIERVKSALYGQEDSNVIRMEDRLPGLAKMAREYSDTMDMLDRGGVRALDSISDGLTDIRRNADDAGEAFERMGARIVETFFEMAQQRFIIGPLAGALDVFVSGFFGGGGKTAGLGKLPGFDRGADIRIGGNPGIDNNLLSINNKPTAWVSADETVRILPNMTGQTGGGGQAPARVELADLNITLKDERGGGQGGRARASERRSANGTRELTLWLKEQIGGMLGSGKFDEEMHTRYGFNPSPGVR